MHFAQLISWLSSAGAWKKNPRDSLSFVSWGRMYEKILSDAWDAHALHMSQKLGRNPNM